MNKPIVSIIVPVYKVEKYLPRCVGSILAQTYADFELILIDDGSPDKSGELCDKYALRDRRVKVIHKENGGVSSARNAGLDVAQGKYITFVDSDDWVAENYLQVLVSAMENNDVQLAVGSFQVRDFVCRTETMETKLLNICELGGKEKISFYSNGNFYGPYIKLFFSTIIQEKKMRFKLNMHYGEDALFVREYLKYCQCVYTLKEVIYFYNRFNDASLTKRFDKNRREWILLGIDHFHNMLVDVGVAENYRNEAIAAYTFERFNNCVAMFIQNCSKKIALKEIKNSFDAFEKYLLLDTDWVNKEDRYAAIRRATLEKNANEIYTIYKHNIKQKKIRVFLSKIKWGILKPYLERKRDGLCRYR